MSEILNLPNRPTAVFVASDVVAIGAIQMIKQFGLQIPKDISIIGFDDIPIAQYLDPPLSTIHLPAYGLGWAAGDRLIRLILGEKLEQVTVLLDTELITRSSIEQVE
jgi:DNA-binding LacI/PurR family transcriptional regulator